MAETAVIEFQGVDFSYDGVPVLENVNFAIGKHELVYIVGPNGGGKTTLLKLILGLIEPDRGEVLVFGKLPRQVRGRIGYTPQHLNYDPRFPVTVMTVALSGRIGSRFTGFYSKSDKRAALAALEMLGIADLAGKLFSELSGGQRQRALIARAIAGDPDILLLDEPTANVDLEAESRLFDVIGELDRRMTILMVSHDLGFVSRAVKSVLCVNRRVLVHPTSEITPEAIRCIYQDDIRMIRHDLRC